MRTIRVKRFNDIEKNLKLFEKKYENFNYWIVIRYSIYQSIINFGEKEQVSEKRSIKILPYIFKNIIYSHLKFKLKKIKKKDIIILATERYMKAIPDGEDNIEIYTSFLSDYYKEASETFVIPKSVFAKNNMLPKDSKWLYFLINNAKMNARIMKMNKRNHYNICKKIKMDIEPAIEVINREFYSNLSCDNIVNEIVTYFYEYCYIKKSFGKIVDKINPKIIVEVCYYDRFNIYINKVSQEKGVNIIELQHGVMGGNHIAYNIDNSNLLGFPDYIMLFSEFWKNTHLPLKNENIIVTGFPMLDESVKYYDIKKKCERNNILFISQWTIGESLYRFASQLSKDERFNGYNIYYKLHPHEKKENYKNIDRIKIVDSSELSLYNIFAICGIQIGAYSTALYEGLAFNLDTYIVFDLDDDKEMEDVCNSGYCEYIYDIDDLVMKIKNNKEKQNSYDEFWKSDAKNNIIDNIESILGDI